VVTRRVEVLVPTVPALVLGSTQRGPVETDLAVVRRRSGGGAVLVGPDDPLWVDVDLPAGDPLWDADVGRSFHWLGRAWAGALADLGVTAEVHTGGFEPGEWGRVVCFAGRGPGEVFLGGAKVVGLAQRRTRAGARFQCAVPTRWDPDRLVDALVAPPDRDRARRDLAGVATAPGVDADALGAALVERLGAGWGVGE
jgi:lipoate-protein ligase A